MFTYINQLGLKGKITLISSGALLLGAISITIGQLEYFQKKKSVEITNELIEQSKAFAEFEFGLAKVNLAAMDALIDEASGKVAPELVEEVESVTSSFKSNRALLTKAAKSVGKEADIESAFKMTEELLSASVLAFNLIETKKGNEKVYAELDDKIDGLKTTATEITKKISEDLDVAYKSQQKLEAETQLFQLILTVLVAVLASFSIFWFGRRTGKSISDSLDKASQSISEIAKDVSMGSEKLQENSSKLSVVVSSQSSAVTETVSAMTEIQGVIRRNNQNLTIVSNALRESRDESQIGLDATSKMMTALRYLKESNKELEEIQNYMTKVTNKTGTINNIVFKTQVLSFNASIEAARAGTQGKGFAVVAQEVGRLAEMSGQTALEIQDILDETKTQVSKIVASATSKVNETLQAAEDVKNQFTGLAERIAAMTGSLSDVELGAKEQAEGVDQCTITMQEMNAGTHAVSQVAADITNRSEQIIEKITKLKAVEDAQNSIVYGCEKGSFKASGPQTNPDVAQDLANVSPIRASEEQRMDAVLEKLNSGDKKSNVA
jgi:methyl-accepting chemotaxis protein